MRLPLAALALSLATVTLTPVSEAAAAAAPAAPAARKAAAGRLIDYTEWDSAAQLRAGTRAGTGVTNGRLVLAKPTARRTFAGRTYDVGHWSSPWVAPGFGFTELIGSWSATTPGDSWIEVKVRGRAASGALSTWDVLGRWTSGDRYVKRTTISGQADDLARVNTDTWATASGRGLTSWQLKVSLHRRAGARTASPSVDTVGAVASRLPDVDAVAASTPRLGRRVVLNVPRYSQMVHTGHYSKWGGGGEAWCSPTSTSMVLGYYGALPKPAEYAWVPQRHTDPWVDHAARSTYDYGYRGTGNWPFNTAYAAPRVGRAFVTRLASLRQAEQFIAAGIPLVASISFGRGELTGAPIGSTNGHLLVIVGFEANGDVVVNDPAGRTNAVVRRTYDRGQFENAWLPRSGGLVYVIAPRDRALPAGTQQNW